MKRNIILVLLSTMAFVFIISSKVNAAEVYYREYDLLMDEYEERDYEEPPCKDGEYWHNWLSIRTINATDKKEGCKIYECMECFCRKYVVYPKLKDAKTLVNYYLKDAKKYKWYFLNSYFYKSSKDYYFPNVNAYVKRYKKVNKKLSWKIKSVKGTDKKCTVKVRVKIPNLYKARYNSVYKWAILQNKQGLSADYIVKQIQKEYFAKIKKYKGKTKTKTITFSLEKHNGYWYIKKRTRTMVDIATGFMFSSWDDAWADAIETFS